jgi:processive 1,2-diacylglycerol beta-glucosyltransferase
VTDFEAHALWMEAGVDLYCVAQPETKAGLVARGVPEDRVIATGIPIAAKFQKPIDASAVRRQMGWRDDLPVLLVLSGGFGMGPVREILDHLDQAASTFQVVVVCGKNEELRCGLAIRNPKHPTHVLGFVTNMHELMAVSELVLTKPGGLTSSESLAMGKPLFILNPIPGQEAANSDFLLEHGAAVKANRLEELPFRIDKLLGTGKQRALSKAAAELGRPRAAEGVCREVLLRLEA